VEPQHDAVGAVPQAMHAACDIVASGLSAAGVSAAGTQAVAVIQDTAAPMIEIRIAGS
jgi:hypothetical protein